MTHRVCVIHDSEKQKKWKQQNFTVIPDKLDAIQLY